MNHESDHRLVEQTPPTVVTQRYAGALVTLPGASINMVDFNSARPAASVAEEAAPEVREQQ
jgi:hypothetical protein